MKKQIVYCDMDGSIADLYAQKDWLQRLRAESKNLFLTCAPMTTEERLFELFPSDKYDIRILSMTPKGASKEYCTQVIEEKCEWLDMYFPHLKKRIFRPYGHNKNLRNSANAILIDDSEEIRKNFRGTALNPAEIF